MNVQVYQPRPMYAIRQDHYSIVQLIQDADGEITPELENQLALTEQEFQEKAVSYGYVIKHFDDRTTVVENEINRLKKILEREEKHKELFKQRLAEGMLQFGVEKIDTPTLKLSFRKSESVEIEDDNLVPEEYKETKLVTTTSKTKIKNAFKEGIKVPGANLLVKQNLQIK